jgi:hypothetical protein
MHRIIDAFILAAIIAGALSCGAPAGPEETALQMFEAAQDRDYDRMMSFLSPEMQGEINEAALIGVEIISYSVGEIEYSDDSTEVELDYTVVMKHIATGESRTEDDDMDMIRTSEGNWVITHM